jgi:hypothetical protein
MAGLVGPEPGGMSNPLRAYGASLAILALNAARAAGDVILGSVATGIADKVPGATEAAVTDLFDAIPSAYRAEVRTLFDPAVLAAKVAVDSGLADRIHTGLAIGQAVLDNRIGALQAHLAAAGPGESPAAPGPPAVIGLVLGAEKGLRAS